MRPVFVVAADLLREARARRWVLALALGITGILGIVAFGLRLEVVDGALAATRFFGESVHGPMEAADVALRPLFRGVSYLVFYGGSAFGILACADFAPSLLAPGRIEHLLSLPVRRWQLLAGTFLGTTILAALGAAYGTAGLTLIIGLKTGVWTARPLLAGLLAALVFAALYGAMLCAAVFVRSAALSAATGGLLLVAGIVAGYRISLGRLFEAGVGRTSFLAVTAVLPRISALADLAAGYAAHQPLPGAHLGRLLAGAALFALATLAVAAWRFTGKDY